MEKVSFLLGRWEGEGRVTRGPQAPPQVVAVTEHVYAKVGGNVVLLEGHATAPDGQGGERSVHDALGVLSYDRGAEVFRMRAFKGGELTDAEVEVGNGKLVWKSRSCAPRHRTSR